ITRNNVQSFLWQTERVAPRQSPPIRIDWRRGLTKHWFSESSFLVAASDNQRLNQLLNAVGLVGTLGRMRYLCTFRWKPMRLCLTPPTELRTNSKRFRSRWTS